MVLLLLPSHKGAADEQCVQRSDVVHAKVAPCCLLFLQLSIPTVEQVFYCTVV